MGNTAARLSTALNLYLLACSKIVYKVLIDNLAYIALMAISGWVLRKVVRGKLEIVKKLKYRKF